MAILEAPDKIFAARAQKKSADRDRAGFELILHRGKPEGFPLHMRYALTAG